MAPIRKRAARATSASIRKPIASDTTATSNSITPQARANTKVAKRKTRHANLLTTLNSRVAKPVPRRRASKKLKTDISALASALPDLDDEGEDDEWEGIDDDAADAPVGLSGRSRRRKGGDEAQKTMVMRSLKTRPGVGKRKDKMAEGERERFRQNLARLAGAHSQSSQVQVGNGMGATGAAADTTASGGADAQSSAAASGATTTADRWAALRGFIGGTMQKSKAFSGTV